MEKSRKHYSAEFKYKMVKEILLRVKTVSEACRENRVSPGLYYRWQEQFLSSAKHGFEAKKGFGEPKTIDRKEQEIVRLKDVIAELSRELVELKKKNLDLM